MTLPGFEEAAKLFYATKHPIAQRIEPGECRAWCSWDDMIVD